MKAQREEVEPPTESACALFDGRNAEVPSRAPITRLSVLAWSLISIYPIPRVSVLLAAFGFKRWRNFSMFGSPRGTHGPIFLGGFAHNQGSACWMRVRKDPANEVISLV